MSKKFLHDRRNDHYYKMAKRDNYRSRAAYKISQINHRFEIFQKGDTVIDMGANPGGWSQIAVQKVGETGKVLALDIKNIEPIPGVIFVRGDARAITTKKKIRELLPESGADVILSDMAPNISGNYSLDHAKSIELAEMALEYTDEFLKVDGHFIVKVFDGDLTGDFFQRIKKRFKEIKRHNPRASRKSSSEMYITAKFKK